MSISQILTHLEAWEIKILRVFGSVAMIQENLYHDIVDLYSDILCITIN